MEIKPTLTSILIHQPICGHRYTLNHHRSQHHPTRDQNTQYIYQESKLRKNNDLLPFLPPQATNETGVQRTASSAGHPVRGTGNQGCPRKSPFTLSAAAGGTREKTEKLEVTISKDV